MQPTPDLMPFIGSAPLAGVCIYLFQQNQKLHKERMDFMQKQLELFQKAALRLSGKGDGDA